MRGSSFFHSPHLLPHIHQKYGKSPVSKFVYWGGFYQKRVLEKLFERLRLREKTFIKLIQKIVRKNPNHSFILIRGSIHKKYFQDIKKTFEQEFNVKKIEYGEQFEDRYPMK